MKEFFNRFGYLVAIVVLIGAFMLWKKDSKPPVAIPPVKTSTPTVGSNATPIPTAAQSANPSYNPQTVQTPAPKPATDDDVLNPKALTDPLCMTDSRGFIILPDFFLKEFYAKPSSWVAIPQSYSRCFKANQNVNIVFFEFDSGYQLPWEPIVKMSARIDQVTAYPTFKDLKKNKGNERYEVKTGRKLETTIFPTLETKFAAKLAEPWVVINLRRLDIEAAPGYWPNSPETHPVARMISLEQFNNVIRKKDINYTIIDARSTADRKKFKLLFDTSHIKRKERAFERTVLPPLKISNISIKGMRKKEISRDYILIGTDEQDRGPFNAANALAIYGHRSVFILSGGAKNLGGPRPDNVQSVGQSINPDQLKDLKRKFKDTLLVVDCRNPASSTGEIPGAFRLTAKDQPQVAAASSNNEEENEDTNFSDNIDIGSLLKEIDQRRIAHIVLFGSTKTDPRPEKVHQLLNRPILDYYQLEQGFQAWSFFAKYKWNDLAAKARLPVSARRGHPPPPQLRPKTPPIDTKIKLANEAIKPGERVKVKPHNNLDKNSADSK